MNGCSSWDRLEGLLWGQSRKCRLPGFAVPHHLLSNVRHDVAIAGSFKLLSEFEFTL
jgi:hypothetical protein